MLKCLWWISQTYSKALEGFINPTNIPSGDQTWRAGKYTIVFGDFPIEPPMNRSWISQLATLTPEGTVPSGKRLHDYRKIHHFHWVTPLQITIFNSYFHITRG